MATLKLSNLHGVREALRKSQAEMATLLGVSKRAVQSYEQGWRPLPLQIRKCAGLLLFLHWRKGERSGPPCWEIRKCSAEARSGCAAYKFDAGDLCWLLHGCGCAGKGSKAGARQMSRCEKCAVTRPWLRM
jgi:DNA-binding XRE family transcriptional regulator